MANDILNEHLRMIYLTEDVFGIGQAISQKVKSLSSQTLTPEKIKQANISVPPLNAIYDLVKAKLPTFGEAKSKIDHIKTSDMAKKAMIVSYASLKDLGESDETLKEHVDSIIKNFLDFVAGITAATTETAVFMGILYLFIRLFKNPTWTVRLLYWATKKFLAASIILIIFYALAKGAWVLINKDDKKEQPIEVED